MIFKGKFTSYIFLSCLFVIISVQHVGAGMISGQILLENGMPMAHGIVAFFDKKTGPAPNPARYLRLPDHIKYLDNEGRFKVTIPLDEFYVGAILFNPNKKSGGPPQKGDITITVKDENGKPKLFVRPKNSDDIHLGIVAAGTLYQIEEKKPQLTAISGTIFYKSSMPAQGVRLLAAKNDIDAKNLFIYFSDDTDSTGAYQLRLPDAGEYALRLSPPGSSGPDFLIKNKDESDVLKKEVILIQLKKGQIIGDFDLMITQ